MIDQPKIIARAEGDFPFTFLIEKALPSEEQGELIVEGIASTTNVDHDAERMSEKALGQMATIINEKSVPLRLEHQKDDEAIVGKVYEAKVDERNQLWIKAVLDKASPFANLLHKALKEGAKLGLSVGGRVKRAARELVESAGKAINTFYDIVIDEVSVTSRPANYDAWLFAKSQNYGGVHLIGQLRSKLFNQFLFENPQLDYLGVFEKSIPNQAWRVVAKEETNMNFRKQTVPIETTTDVTKVTDTPDASEAMVTAKQVTTPTESPTPVATKQQEVTPTETPTATKQETKPTEETPATTTKAIRALEKMVADGFEKMFAIIKGVVRKQTEATGGQVSPLTGTETPEELAKEDEVPTEVETTKDEVVPAEETTPITPAEALKQLEALDQTQPKTETTNPEITAKEETTPTGTTTTETTATATKQTGETPYGAEYAMPQLKSAVKRINILAKAYPARVVRKSVMPSIDEFVYAVTEAVNGIVRKMENDGKRILGLEQAVTDAIRNDSVIQKSIRTMLSEPGQKRSVSLGIPYMITKEGRKYALTANEVGVQKSVSDEKRPFKEVYKSEFSSEKLGM